MPKLKNPRHELEAHRLIENNFNQQKTYKETRPASTERSIHSNAQPYMANNGIIARAKELVEKALQKTESLHPDKLIASLDEDLTSKRAIVVDKSIQYVRDNANILETKKYILNNIYGLKKDCVVGDDNRQIIFNLSSPEHLDKLSSIVGGLKDLRKSSTDDDIINGEVVDDTSSDGKS